MVSAACNAGVSSSPTAAAMPPWAYPVLLSAGSALVRISTRPAGASPIAARRPATPPPTIRKSVEPTRCYPTKHPMDPVRIDVATPSRAYSVTIAAGALEQVGRLLDD